jgi:hypothetical protein
VLNDKNELSPAVTWTFKMRAVNDVALPGAMNGEPDLQNEKSEKKFKQFTVRFDKLEVFKDHDEETGATLDSGEWYLRAFVQGHMLNLVQGQAYIFCKNDIGVKEITIDIRDDEPLTIFTLGFESDFPINPLTMCKVNDAKLSKNVAQIFTFAPQDRVNKIIELDKNGGGLKGYFVPPCQFGQKLGLFHAQFSLGKEDGTYTTYSLERDFALTYTVSSIY